MTNVYDGGFRGDLQKPPYSFCGDNFLDKSFAKTFEPDKSYEIDHS